MTVSTRKRQKILDDMKKCFGRLGFPIIDERTANERYAIISKYQYQYYGFGIGAVYHPKGDLVEIQIGYGLAPEDKIGPIYELVNHINSCIMTGHFYITHETGEVSFRAAVHVSDSLNEEEFEWALNQALSASYKFFPAIGEQLFSDREPKDIFKELLEREHLEVDS
jgi:hypothetical protein